MEKQEKIKSEIPERFDHPCRVALVQESFESIANGSSNQPRSMKMIKQILSFGQDLEAQVHLEDFSMSAGDFYVADIRIPLMFLS